MEKQAIAYFAEYKDYMMFLLDMGLLNDFSKGISIYEMGETVSEDYSGTRI